MRKSTPSDALLAWTLVATALAGCIAQPPVPDGPSVSLASRAPGITPRPASATAVVATPADPAPTDAIQTVEPIAAAACQLQRQPGPADVAPTKGDLMDWSHIFGGRVRLCLGGVQPIEVEARAYCQWSDPFDAIRDVNGLPARVDAETGEVDAGLSLDRGIVYLSLTASDGGVRSWEGGPIGQEIRSHDQGRRGIARFDLGPSLDPEHPPAVVLPNLVGLLRWVCLDPPAG